MEPLGTLALLILLVPGITLLMALRIAWVWASAHVRFRLHWGWAGARTTASTVGHPWLGSHHRSNQQPGSVDDVRPHDGDLVGRHLQSNIGG